MCRSGLSTLWLEVRLWCICGVCLEVMFFFVMMWQWMFVIIDRKVKLLWFIRRINNRRLGVYQKYVLNVAIISCHWFNRMLLRDCFRGLFHPNIFTIVNYCINKKLSHSLPLINQSLPVLRNKPLQPHVLFIPILMSFPHSVYTLLMPVAGAINYPESK